MSLVKTRSIEARIGLRPGAIAASRSAGGTRIKEIDVKLVLRTAPAPVVHPEQLHWIEATA